MTWSPFSSPHVSTADRPGAGPWPMGAGVRVFQTVASQPSWVLRFAAISAGMALMTVLLVLLIPVVLVGLLAFFAAATVARVRSWFRGLRAPNGRLDGRRNVRVIVRQPE